MASLRILAILCAVVAPATAGAAAPHAMPPLDCQRAEAEMERVVCGDGGLRALDREVQRLYGLAHAAVSGRRLEGLDEAQRGWLLRRGDCRNAVDRRACLVGIHLDRIATLRLHHAAARAADERGTSRGPVAFECGGTPLAATFVAGEPALVHLRWRGAGHALTQVESGSGAGYQGPGGALFWSKGGDAELALPDGTRATCRERDRRP